MSNLVHFKLYKKDDVAMKCANENLIGNKR